MLKRNLRKRRKRKRKRRTTDFKKVYKKEARREMDETVLDSIGKSEYKNFKEYKDDMESFTFDSVFGG